MLNYANKLIQPILNENNVEKGNELIETHFNMPRKSLINKLKLQLNDNKLNRESNSGTDDNNDVEIFDRESNNSSKSKINNRLPKPLKSNQKQISNANVNSNSSKHDKNTYQDGDNNPRRQNVSNHYENNNRREYHSSHSHYENNNRPPPMRYNDVNNYSYNNFDNDNSYTNRNQGYNNFTYEIPIIPGVLRNGPTVITPR